VKHLAIDYGEKRTGIAVSDTDATMAFPLTTILMRGKDAFFSELLLLAEAERIEAFVVGLPLRENGEESESARRSRNMALRLKRRSPLPVFLMPENLSSWDAETRLRDAGKRGKELAKALDKASAAAILESFLALPEDRRRQFLF
jgi:putative Holliday junction resolvase